MDQPVAVGRVDFGELGALHRLLEEDLDVAHALAHARGRVIDHFLPSFSFLLLLRRRRRGRRRAAFGAR
jgi:hypothetical protein